MVYRNGQEDYDRSKVRRAKQVAMALFFCFFFSFILLVLGTPSTRAPLQRVLFFILVEDCLGVGATGLNTAIRPPCFELLVLCCTQSIHTRNSTVLSPFGSLVSRLLPIVGLNVTTTALFRTTSHAFFHNSAFVDIMVAASMPYQRGESFSLDRREDTRRLTAKIY